MKIGRISAAGIAILVIALALGALTQRNSRLHQAAQVSSLSAVRLWLMFGADPNWRGRDGRTALHVATERTAGPPAILSALLDAGADPNALSREGISPFENALMVGTPEMVALLKQRGANPELVKADGLRALESAAYWGHSGFAERLAKNGANVNSVSGRGLTPLGLAVSSMRNPPNEGRLLKGFNYESTVLALINEGADPDSGGPGKPAPLVLLFQDQNWAGKMRWDIAHSVGYLLAKGADVNARTREGETVLHLALLANAPDEMIKALLDRFADPSLLNSRGQSSIDFAKAARRTATVALMGSYSETQRAAAISSYWRLGAMKQDLDLKMVFEIQLRDGSVTRVNGIQFSHRVRTGGSVLGALGGRRATYRDEKSYRARVGPIEFLLPLAIVRSLTANRDATQRLLGYSAVLANGSPIGFDSLEATTVAGTTRIAGQNAVFSASLASDLVCLRRVD